MAGYFITFEGGEGTGKTSIIKAVNDYFTKKGLDLLLSREPGGSKISEQIRQIILDKSNTEMAKECEALLYAASRVQHLTEVIIPALNADKVVICDRYLDSSLAYQGYARGLGFDSVLDINLFAKKYMPDLTIFIDVVPEIALKRITKRNNDRLDLESLKFHDLVYEGYQEVARRYPNRIVKVNGNRPLNEIYEEVIKIIEEKISR